MMMVVLDFVNLIVIMKMIQKGASLRTAREGKENEPANAIQKLRSRAQGKKLGLDVKEKILRVPHLDTRWPLAQRINPNHSQDRVSLATCKSVSFDNGERVDSPGLLRHNSKKSILKKSLTKLRSSLSLKSSQISLANSHVGSQDQSTDNAMGNKAIREKYEQTLSSLKLGGRKFRDEVYPPLQASIYLNNSLMRNFCMILEREGRGVEWMRLPELFRNRQLVLCSPNSNYTIASGPLSRSSDYLPGAFNLLSQRKSLLERIFEGQGVSEEGIYVVKIHMTQQSIWKYVIIDDYIPVVVNKRLPPADRLLPENVLPAFLSVHSQDNSLDIWPFLLQKAYAKYYSTYDSLANGSIYDFVEEIAGVFLEQMPTSCGIDRIRKVVRNEDAILLGEDRKGGFHPLKNTTEESDFAFMDRQNSFASQPLTNEQFLSKFQAVHFSYLHKYYQTSKCQVQQEHVRTTREEGFLLRHIQIEQAGQCQMGVVQKEQRFFRALLTYQYSWMRLVLVQKDVTGYRWIAAAYSNSKTIKLSAHLTPGHYILIILPEWKQKSYDFQLLYFGTAAARFERRPYEPFRNILQESCMDLAQRFGKMAQINRNLCSYHYIERSLGFIIQNINNEKQSGSARIMRSIEGLEHFGIKPLNPEFLGKKVVEVVIPSMGHFTVILVSTGGVQQAILSKFDFGCK